MNELIINQDAQEIVLYFGTKDKAINAYTLATTLVSLADAIKSANGILNPGYEVEVLVTDLGSGSFKAIIKTIYKGLNNLFSKDNIKAVLLGIVSTFIYEKFLTTTPNVTVNVSKEYVIIEQGENKIIVPQELYEAKELIERTSNFSQKISQAISCIKNDSNIESIGLMENNKEKPEIEVNRESFDNMIIDNKIPEENTRTIVEIADVQITRAILENSKRKWEFVWHGEKIPAPILDDSFYNEFIAHNIRIAPGDTFQVELKLIQEKVPGLDVYINKNYEIQKVLKHTPSEKEKKLFE
jgi:hypothetical protein